MAEIARVGRLGREAFQRDFLRPGVPVLIERPAPWPASVWNVETLATLGRDVEVTLEVGDALRGETRLSHARLETYVRRCLAGAAPPSDAPAAYLSVFDLLEPFPQLREAMDFSLFQGAKRFERVRAWLGPAGSLTGFHYDIGDNLFRQLFGAKRVVLAPPHCRDAMSPSGKYDFMSVLSGVDEQAPHASARFEATRAERVETTVEAGQMLFIPRLWWHRVESLTASISVNCFAWSRRELPRYGWEVLRYALHDAGLWGRRGGAHCVCHAQDRAGGTGLRTKLLQPLRRGLEAV